MAFYRWGTLEQRLEKRTDLRLGLGKFQSYNDLPNDLPHYVLCAGGTGARRLISTSVKYLLREKKGQPFELVIFHAEDGKDPEGFFYELLQRVVSQQIAPVFADRDFILTVKILPGNLIEGLQTLKKTNEYKGLMMGTGKRPESTAQVAESISNEIEIDVINLGIKS